MILIALDKGFKLWIQINPAMLDVRLGWLSIRVSFLGPQQTIFALVIAMCPWLSWNDFYGYRLQTPVVEPTELW